MNKEELLEKRVEILEDTISVLLPLLRDNTNTTHAYMRFASIIKQARAEARSVYREYNTDASYVIPPK